MVIGFKGWWATWDETANWTLTVKRESKEEVRFAHAKALLKAGTPFEAIASEIGYHSADAFRKAFGDHVGSSPTQWLIGEGLRDGPEQRLAKAEALLMSGERRMGMVAKLAGYKTHQGLGAAFRAAHGMSPTEWIRRQPRAIEIMPVPPIHRKRSRHRQ